MLETGSFIERVALLNAFLGTKVLSFVWAKALKLKRLKANTMQKISLKPLPIFILDQKWPEDCLYKKSVCQAHLSKDYHNCRIQAHQNLR